MATLKKIKDFILKLLGFKRNSKYVSSYLNEANIRSSVYMGVVVVALEFAMICRSMDKYNIFHYILNHNLKNGFDYLFANTSLYWLFMFAGFAMMMFSITYLVDKQNPKKKSIVLPFVFSGILILSTIFIFKEADGFKNWDVRYYKISNIGVIFLYIFSFMLALTIIGHTIYKIKFSKNSQLLSETVIIMFALICLTFGVKVGYTDFFSRFYLGSGLPKVTSDGIYEIKSIICFLTMIIYVACLLIWKPYISIIMLTTIFAFFYKLVSGDPKNRIFPDGEYVNYITFLISLTMIAISIYQQRVSEAEKDSNLEYRAKYDELTGIFNFQHFCSNILDKQINNPSSLKDTVYLFFNIENFKDYNDKRTFQKGDELLSTFASYIKDEFIDGVYARQGDDHFVALSNLDTYEEKIRVLSNKLMALDDDLQLKLKVGGYIPSDDDKPIRAVDKARYACGTISNKYDLNFAMYDEKMDKAFHKRQYIINNIDKAVANGWIVPYYQPVVWSKDKRLCGCEALCRWIDPTYGFLSPGEFIPVLEECRQIHKLDMSIWDSVCRMLNEAKEAGKPIMPISLNFSRLDFELMDAVEVIEGLVAKYNIDKQYIHIEITESALTDNLTILHNAIAKLKKDGFAIWLDDFGSGYSSLNVLKDYSFDVLKIDMKFLSNFSSNNKTKDILDCIIQLADCIGMKTLTEGVETKEEADFLSEIGCGRLQGYLYGKPIPFEDLQNGIAEGKFILSADVL